MPTKRALIWTAVSSEEQARDDKESLAHQEQQGREHAARHGLHVVGVLRSDDSRSIVRLDVAMRNPNLGYAALVDAIDGHTFDVLLFYSVDRLGRNMALVTTVQELCRAAGIALYDCSNPPATINSEAGDMERIVGGLQGAMAQAEIDKLRKRARFGRTARAKRGMFLHRIPYGYVADEHGHIVEDTAAAAVVRRIYSEYLSGHGLPRIADGLNADGIPTPRGNVWQVGTVAYILNNVQRYAGWLEHNRYSRRWHDPYMRVRGQWPALIDDATAERITSERAERAANRQLADTQHLLSGVVWCMECRAPLRLSTTNSGSRNVKRLTYLRCNAPAHPFWQVRADAIMPYVLDKIQQLTLADIDALCAADDAPDRTQEQIDAARRDLDRLTRAVSQADNDYYIAGKLDADRHTAIVQRLQADIATRTADLARLEQQQHDRAAQGSRRDRLTAIMADGANILRSAAPAAANVWLRKNVRVWLSGRDLTGEDLPIVEWRL